MPWLTIHFNPGFADDLTCWRAEIELDGSLVQRVDEYPSGREVVLRSEVAAGDVAKLETIVNGMDFDLLADRHRIPGYVDDLGDITVSHTRDSSSLKFFAQLPYWEWCHRKGRLQYSDYPGIEAAVELWRVVAAMMPYRRDEG